MNAILAQLKEEKFLLLAIIAACVAYPLEHTMLSHGHSVALISGIALIAAIICASLRVAHHAELLAHKVGDPYGTMILTLAAVLVEVVILGIMMSNEPSPTLVRDTIYSAVMLDINGILGLAALMGGLKHGEQSYNDDSARSYSVMILTAMGVSMVVPEFIPEGDWKLYSGFTIGAMLLLYGLFLRMQVGRTVISSATATRRKNAAVMYRRQRPPALWTALQPAPRPVLRRTLRPLLRRTPHPPPPRTLRQPLRPLASRLPKKSPGSISACRSVCWSSGWWSSVRWQR
jgi:Ca2+/H+ antiporter